jgi:hypothetical protein
LVGTDSALTGGVTSAVLDFCRQQRVIYTSIKEFVTAMRHLIVASTVFALMVILAPVAEAGKRGSYHHRYSKQRTQVSQLSQVNCAPQAVQVVYVDSTRLNGVASQGQTVRTPSSGQTYTVVPSRVATVSSVQTPR